MANIPMSAPSLYKTDLPEENFPLECPYDLEYIFSNSFYPGEPSQLVNPQ